MARGRQEMGWLLRKVLEGVSNAEHILEVDLGENEER